MSIHIIKTVGLKLSIKSNITYSQKYFVPITSQLESHQTLISATQQQNIFEVFLLSYLKSLQSLLSVGPQNRKNYMKKQNMFHCYSHSTRKYGKIKNQEVLGTPWP
jgi:hypothetical protein